MIERSEYNELMAKIADGGKVNKDTHEKLMEFAKAKKAKRPPADAIIDMAAVKAAKTTQAREPKAPKEPKVKAKCDPKTVGSDELCETDARSNGLCSKHYTRLVYRANPENMEKARKASRDYAERMRKLKAAEKAAVAEVSAA